MKTNVADRPLPLAAHMRSLSALLKTQSVDYSWSKHERCNCGLLACAITGMSAYQLRRAIEPLIPRGDADKTWRGMATNHCPITGRPTNEIFAQLFDAGLQINDFSELERLSNPVVRNRMLASGYTITKVTKRFFQKPLKAQEVWTEKDVFHSNATHVAAYLKAWAELIEEFHFSHAAPAPTEQQLDAVETRPLVQTP